uniref:USP domain-containing protein n=1 Tax=Meloidogyne enterolobii TaxID=390850 RepID=A0A6V7W5J4_MELEN|nr:unnamed protein product [Meloidogyne enterolobii]
MHERSNYYQTNYNLYAMVIHIGSLEHGHYVAVLKQSNKWLLYNDDERKTEITNNKQTQNFQHCNSNNLSVIEKNMEIARNCYHKVRYAKS